MQWLMAFVGPFFVPARLTGSRRRERRGPIARRLAGRKHGRRASARPIEISQVIAGMELISWPPVPTIAISGERRLRRCGADPDVTSIDISKHCCNGRHGGSVGCVILYSNVIVGKELLKCQSIMQSLAQLLRNRLNVGSKAQEYELPAVYNSR